MNTFVFDVDGTLTPSRSPIDEGFRVWFTNWIKRNRVYIVTGSDYAKTVEQLGSEICESVQMCYNCAGNSRWQGGQCVYESDFKLPDDAWLWLENELYKSRFFIRTSQHIEERAGLVNFSVVGRGANASQRQQYVEYDNMFNERENIADRFNKMFEKITASVAGDTGLDIYKTGCDKGQVYDLIEKPVIFFGDKTQPGGNDFPLADRCEGENDLVYPVSSWEDTANILMAYYG